MGSLSTGLSLISLLVIVIKVTKCLCVHEIVSPFRYIHDTTTNCFLKVDKKFLIPTQIKISFRKKGESSNTFLSVLIIFLPAFKMSKALWWKNPNLTHFVFFWCQQFSELEKHTKGTFNTCSFHLAWTEVIECVYLVYEREMWPTSLGLDRQKMWDKIHTLCEVT